MAKARVTKEQFIELAKEQHSDKYDYSKVKYVNNLTKITIICKRCKELGKPHEFIQIPKNHKRGIGCPRCSPTFKYTTETFIVEAKNVHGDLYDYSLINYTSARKKIEIICKEHGIFKQMPYKHLQKRGCPVCTDNKKLTKEIFIDRSNIKHRNKYDYTHVEYINTTTLVKIICPTHGEFYQIPKSHLTGSGCPTCNESTGEKAIRYFLEDNNIKFEKERSFDDCRNINPLPFDFYIPQLNTCIEFDGIQHYEINEFFGGQKAFDTLQIRDNIKNKYCKDNNLNLIRIRFDEIEEINNILTKQLNE